MKQLAFAFILTIIPYAAAPCAHAVDFTFNVPVEFHGIPGDIKTFGVDVVVYDRSPDSQGRRDLLSRIGAAYPPHFPFVNGEYTGTVTLQFNADPGKNPANAVSYDAWFTLQGPPGYQGGCMSAMGLNTPYPYDPTKPMTCQVTGSIPQAAPASSTSPQSAPATTSIQRRAPLGSPIRPLVPPR